MAVEVEVEMLEGPYIRDMMSTKGRRTDVCQMLIRQLKIGR